MLNFEALSRRERDTALKWFQEKKILLKTWEHHFGYKTQWPNSQSVKQDRDIDEQSEEMNAPDMTAAKQTPVFLTLFFVN